MSNSSKYWKTILACFVFNCILGWSAGIFMDIYANILVAPVTALLACLVVVVFNLLFFYKKSGPVVQFLLPGVLYLIFAGVVYRSSSVDLIVNGLTAVLNLFFGLRFYSLAKSQGKEPVA